MAASPIYLCLSEKAGAAKSGGVEGKCPAPTAKVKYAKVALPKEEAEQQKLLAILPYIKYEEKGVGGKPTIQLSGVNLQILNGEGKTTSVNGAGNLVIGYDESPGTQSGSHDLVLGQGQTFTSYAGILAGKNNMISAPFASITGGSSNTASGENASISGGLANTASGVVSSVSGGGLNNATFREASVSGGYRNEASGENASVTGGEGNKATAVLASISGGFENTASATDSWVGGGRENKAEALFSSVFGGKGNKATKEYEAIP
jgi:hypothetical protein